MPRSSFSHNPLLRVSRPVSACSRCRNAKVKCDGKLPACTACEKAGRENECSAANDNFARGKERSYVAALELRIEKLEKRLAYAKSFKASVAQDGADDDNVKSEPSTVNSTPAATSEEADRRDSLAAIRAAVHRKAAKDREAADVNNIVSDFGFLTINATVRDFDYATTNLTFARFVLAAVTNNPLPDPSDFVLPQRQIAQSIVQFYMANVYALFPCVAETTILTALDDLYNQHTRVMSGADHWLVYMVLAIGSAAQSRRTEDVHYRNGVSFMSKALDYADQSLALGSVTQLRSLVLLTIYSTLDPSHFDSWHLVGFAARAIIDLGYHQDPRPSTVADGSSLDMRRKLFYCVYALDRDISMVHAKALSFTDQSTNVAFPKSSNRGRKESVPSLMTGPSSSDAALMLFQLRRAQSYWYQELYLSRNLPLQTPIPYLWQMCLEMREWGESLPDSLPLAIRKMFEQELTYSYVYCLSPSVRVPHTTDYNRCLVFEYTQQYLNNMYDIAHATVTEGLYTYHDALKVLFTANQLLGVLREAENMLLNGPWPHVPIYQPGSTPPPPMPKQAKYGDAAKKAARSLSCLEKVSETLGKFAERWEAVGLLKESFEAMGHDMIEHLRARLESQPGHNNVQWVGVGEQVMQSGQQSYNRQ